MILCDVDLLLSNTLLEHLQTLSNDLVNTIVHCQMFLVPPRDTRIKAATPVRRIEQN